MAQPPNVVFASLIAIGVLAGGACLTLTRASVRPPLVIAGETVEAVDAAVPDPVPGERYVPYVWRFEDLYARTENFWTPRAAREVSGDVRLAWDGIARFLQIASDATFTGERRHWDVGAGGVALSRMFTGKNFWRVSADGRRWSPAREFEIEPEFLSGAPVITGADVLRLSGFSRYVVEYAADASFADVRALVIEGSTFRPGARGFVRARGLNARGEVSATSAVRALP